MARETIKYHAVLTKMEGGTWHADLIDDDETIIASGRGDYGPLDALSNAANTASNCEYLETHVRGDG